LPAFGAAPISRFYYSAFNLTIILLTCLSSLLIASCYNLIMVSSNMPNDNKTSGTAQTSHTNGSNPAPSKKSWYKRKRNVITIAVLILLFILGSAIASGGKNKKVTNSSENHATSATKKTSASNPYNIPSEASKLSPTQKTYFNTVWIHLYKVGNLNQAINSTCASAKFPPQQSCAINIQTYRQELLAAKGDLTRVTAPVSFQQADATMRKALDEDLQATAQALDALQNSKQQQWIESLELHGQAGRDLKLAGNQALSVVK
jgi:hypothetical protein